MPIIRVEKNKNYTTMSNYHLKDKNLSLKAKGLMSLMLSLPEDWDYSVLGLSKICCEGKDCITNTLNELENNKYLVREQSRMDKGQFGGANYILYENPLTENPHTDNPPQLNTNINKKENIIINNNKKEKTIKELLEEQEAELKPILVEFIEMRKKMKKPLTDYAFKLLLNKLEKLSGGFRGNKMLILNQSILNGWQDVYEYKGEDNSFKGFKNELVNYAKELAGEKGDKYALAILHNWKRQNINDLEVAKKSTELFIKGVGNQNKDNFILHERKYTKEDFDSIVCDIDEIDI